MKWLNDSKVMLMILVFVLTIMLIAVNTNADFTFGEPVNLRSVFPFLDPLHESIDCFSHDGLEMYVESDRPGGSGKLDIWISRRSTIESDWGPLENLGPVVNSSQHDNGVWISRDGLTLYFNSNRSGGYGKWDIYMTSRTRTDASWSQPVNLGPKINSSDLESGPLMSEDNLELYFSSDRSDGYGLDDIYVAKRGTVNDPWGDPVNLGPIVNSAYEDAGMFLSPDGLVLFFSDNFQVGETPRPDGYGGSDMWMTKRASLSEPWQPPINLGPQINSSMHELGPRLSPDGFTLYFATALSMDWSTWENWQASIESVVDFNVDGIVDAADVCIMIEHWLTDDPMCDIGPMPWGDGIVDVQDLTVLAERLFEETPPVE